MCLRLLVTALLFFGVASASNQREPFGTREFTQEQMEQIRLSFKEEPRENAIKAKGHFSLEPASKCVTQVGYKGGSLILCDGSVWEVKGSDRSVVRKWFEFGIYELPVYVTTNNDWLFSSEYPFEIINGQTGERARVLMSHAPYTAQTYVVTYIDYNKNLVEIMNPEHHQMLFSLTMWDDSVLAYWQLGDRIFVGRNTTWNQVGSPYLLLNIESLSSCRGDIGRW